MCAQVTVTEENGAPFSDEIEEGKLSALFDLREAPSKIVQPGQQSSSISTAVKIKGPHPTSNQKQENIHGFKALSMQQKAVGYKNRPKVALPYQI
jgi:hypothetical protein